MSKQRFTVTYDGETETYDVLDDDTMTFAEARAIEKVTGIAMTDAKAVRGVDHIQAAFWVAMKRKHPTLTFSELDDMVISSFDVADDSPKTGDGDGESDDAGPLGGGVSDEVDSAGGAATSPS